jgi:hypothetical protein
MNREHFRMQGQEPMAMVRTWCRVCGQSSLVGVPLDYDRAVDVVHWIDDQIMDHEDHSEAGGWGVHWRLDDVLLAVFPGRHQETFFPIPPWYPHRRDPGIELSVLKIIKKNGVDRIL